jgi:glutathione S-transferase
MGADRTTGYPHAAFSGRAILLGAIGLSTAQENTIARCWPSCLAYQFASCFENWVIGRNVSDEIFNDRRSSLTALEARCAMSGMKLYYGPGACSLAPHIVLEEVGARFELARVDLAANQQNSPEYLRINAKGRVPALGDGDFILTEAPAILRYIAARHPAAGLWPWDPREEARCAEWLNWLSSTIHIAFAHVRRAARYASDPRAVEDVAATAKKTCRELWQAVDTKLGEGPWAIGERYSVADPYLLVYWTWGRGPALGFDMARELPHWTAHARRLGGRPAVQRAFATEGLMLPA